MSNYGKRVYGEKSGGGQAPLPLASDGLSIPMQSPPATNAAFTVVGASGCILNSGGAITTDPDPNITPPAAPRIVVVSPAPGVVQNTGAGFFRGLTLDGTSLTVQGWMFENTLGQWIKWGPAATLTTSTGSALIVAFAIGSLVGSKWFGQVTTNTGTVTKALMLFM